MTIAEKILAKHWVEDLSEEKLGVPAVKPGDAGFVRTDIRFSHEYVTPMASTFWDEFAGEDAGLNDPDSIYFFRDHLAFLDQVITEERKKAGLLDAAHALHDRQREFAARKGIRLHGELSGRVGSEAICHVKVLGSYALPGPGGGRLRLAHPALRARSAAWRSASARRRSSTRGRRATCGSKSRARVKVEVSGKLADNVAAKDLILEVLAHPYVRDGDAIGKIIEYTGEAVEALSIDERATLTNMAAEIGAFTGIVAPDRTTVDWLVEQRGMDRAEVEAMIDGPPERRGRRVRMDDADRRLRAAADGRDAGRPGQRHADRRAARRGADRHRVRRVVHGGEAGRHPDGRRGREGGAGARRAGGRRASPPTCSTAHWKSKRWPTRRASTTCSCRPASTCWRRVAGPASTRGRE